MQVYIDDKGLFGQYNNLVYVWVDARTGKRYKFFKDEILHFRTSVSFDGIMGLAVKEILKPKLMPKPLVIQAKMLEMKLTDAQFVEINKMSSLSVAAAFGIGPNVINDY